MTTTRPHAPVLVWMHAPGDGNADSRHHLVALHDLSLALCARRLKFEPSAAPVEGLDPEGALCAVCLAERYRLQAHPLLG